MSNLPSLVDDANDDFLADKALFLAHRILKGETAANVKDVREAMRERILQYWRKQEWFTGDSNTGTFTSKGRYVVVQQEHQQEIVLL